MKHILTKLSLAVPSLVLAFTTLVAVPVLADHGQSTDDTTSGSSGSGSSGSGDTATETSDTRTTEIQSETDKGQIETELRQKGTVMLTELRKQGKEHSAEERKVACEAHKQGLMNKSSHITTAMAAYQTRIDAILAKVQAYQKTNNVTVTNWDSLLAAATSAQTTSATTIAALKVLTPSVDCNSTSVAQDVATFKTGAEQARTDLKAYKTAVRALVKGLLDAKTTTEGSNN